MGLLNKTAKYLADHESIQLTEICHVHQTWNERDFRLPPRSGFAWRLDMGQTGCSETSATSYQFGLSYIPEGRTSLPHTPVSGFYSSIVAKTKNWKKRSKRPELMEWSAIKEEEEEEEKDEKEEERRKRKKKRKTRKRRIRKRRGRG